MLHHQHRLNDVIAKIYETRDYLRQNSNNFFMTISWYSLLPVISKFSVFLSFNNLQGAHEIFWCPFRGKAIMSPPAV